jgi:hypothetical protein
MQPLVELKLIPGSDQLGGASCSCTAMLAGMPRPSRVDEAKEQLQAYYDERGAMPSIQAFAELMGYRSPSSAHDVTKALVLAGFLARDERGGRLMPGPGFPRGAAASNDQLPNELRELLTTDAPLLVTVVSGKAFEGEGLLKGGPSCPGDLRSGSTCRQPSCWQRDVSEPWRPGPGTAGPSSASWWRSSAATAPTSDAQEVEGSWTEGVWQQWRSGRLGRLGATSEELAQTVACGDPGCDTREDVPHWRGNQPHGQSSGPPKVLEPMPLASSRGTPNSQYIVQSTRK